MPEHLSVEFNRIIHSGTEGDSVMSYPKSRNSLWNNCNILCLNSENTSNSSLVSLGEKDQIGTNPDTNLAFQLLHNQKLECPLNFSISRRLHKHIR